MLLVHVMMVVVACCVSVAHVFSCKGRHFVLIHAAWIKLVALPGV